MFTYLILDFLTLLFPLLLSFDKKVAFFSNWRAFLPAITINAVLFLIWDALFTSVGVWEFNPDYVLPLRLFGMPIEEYLFFFVVPYACLFIYECLRHYLPKDYLFKFRKWIIWLIIIGVLLAYNQYYDRLYSAVTFLAIFLTLMVLLLRRKTQFFGWFFLSYLVALLPFAIVNGVLTARPVLIYNDLENMGVRVGSIPLDDFFYNFLMLLLTTAFYEKFKKREEV